MPLFKQNLPNNNNKKQDSKPSSSDQVKQQMLALTLHLEITSREAAKFSHDLI